MNRDLYCTLVIVSVAAISGCSPIKIRDDKGNPAQIPVPRYETYRVIVETVTSTKVIPDDPTTTVDESRIEQATARTESIVHLPTGEIAYTISPTTTLGGNAFNVALNGFGAPATFGATGDSGVSAMVSAAAGAINPIATVTGSNVFNPKAGFLPDGDMPRAETETTVYRWDRQLIEWVEVDSTSWKPIPKQP